MHRPQGLRSLSLLNHAGDVPLADALPRTSLVIEEGKVDSGTNRGRTVVVVFVVVGCYLRSSYTIRTTSNTS